MNLPSLIAAFMCTTTISLLPNLLLFIFPDIYAPNSPTLSIGQALAAGALLGDVFLHTLPHALMGEGHDHSGHEHDHDHSHGGKVSFDQIETIGFAIMFGFLVFLIFDAIVRTFGNHDHHHDHHHSHGHHHDDEKKDMGRGWNMSSVLLSLIGDSLHNFTDGIAIGASFASSTKMTSTGTLIEDVTRVLQSKGGLASLAVLLHEVPHELGDFAILVSSGMSKYEAIMAQFTTAIGAYVGTYVGLFGMEHMKLFFGIDLMIPFTAGGFIYLASVTIIPSILEKKYSLMMRMLQVMSFVIGITFMYFVGVLEHAGGHSHDHSAHGHTEHAHYSNKNYHTGDHHHSHHDHHSHHNHHSHDHNHEEF